MSFTSGFDEIVRLHEPLAPHTWMGIGGPVEFFAEPRSVDELQSLVKRAAGEGLPIRLLGGGSNVLVRDDGVPGVVVRLGKPFATVERLNATTLRCGGGASGILVSSTARDAGIAGVEFLRSIPGTVGGFVRMNGGAYGREVKDALAYLALMKEELGRPWLEPALFRIGASSLLGDIKRQLEHHVTGRYSAGHRHPMA